jgi:hypothetical protein
MRSLGATISGRAAELAICAILVAATCSVLGCASGAAVAGGSTQRTASDYGSASAYIRLAPNQAFNHGVELMLERGDIEITDIKEADNRCKAVTGSQKLTLRVIEAGPGRSRLSMLVGGGNDRDANQELAGSLIRAICNSLSVSCEFAPGTP